jgi:sugar phosphate isomerase/epimerase
MEKLMKLSCLPVSFYDDLTAGHKTLADWFAFAAELGLDGADVSVAHLPNRSARQLAEIRQQAVDAGVTIPMVVSYSDFTHPEEAYRQRQIDILHKDIETAAYLGASFLRVTAGQGRPGLMRSDGIAWAIEGLTACTGQAAQAGLKLVYENHTLGYGWTYVDFSNPADIFNEIVAFTEGSGLEVLFDTANNQARGDDPLAVLRRNKHRIATLHLSDIRQVGQFEPVVIGTGVAPIKTVLQAMSEAGFDDWISIEEASKTGPAGVRAAVAYVDATWVAAGGEPRRSP